MANPTAFEQLIQRNIDAISRIEKAATSGRTRTDVIADRIASFCGSIGFLWVHAGVIGGWIAWNSFGPQEFRFDPPPSSNLNLCVSIEAIFLATFLLISQNRQQRLADQRNHLDLQVNLVAEQESSQMLLMMRKVVDHFDIPIDTVRADALQEATDPEVIADQIQQTLEPDAKPTV